LRDNEKIKNILGEIGRIAGPKELVIKEKIDSVKSLIEKQEKYVNNEL